MTKEADKYPNAEVIWCQEEPLNAGAWAYVRPRIEASCRETSRRSPWLAWRSPVYVGRPPSAAPATGLAELHKMELSRLVDEALS